MDENDPLDAESLDLPPSRETQRSLGASRVCRAGTPSAGATQEPNIERASRPRGASRFKRWAAPAMAVAATALAAVFLMRTPDDGASLVAVSGEG